MSKTILALAALGLATAAQAQVAGGVSGQVEATVETPAPNGPPTLEERIDRVIGTADQASDRAQEQVEEKTERAGEALEDNAERAADRADDTAAKAEVRADAEAPGPEVPAEAHAEHGPGSGR